MKDIIVIGAGITGLTAAQQLQQAGYSVRVIDKGREVGGRTATRQVEVDGLSYGFDYGCASLQINNDAFKQQCRKWDEQGIQFRRTSEHNRGFRVVGGMRTIALRLAGDLDVQKKSQVERLITTEEGWKVITNRESEQARKLVITIPTPQALELFSESGFHTSFDDELSNVEYSSVWTVLATLYTPVDTKELQQFVYHDSDLDSVLDNVGRDVSLNPAYTFMYSSVWTEGYLNEPFQHIEYDLMRRWRKRWPELPFRTLKAHRWRYARPSNPSTVGYLHDPALSIWYAGDALQNGSFEGSWLAGNKVSKALINFDKP